MVELTEIEVRVLGALVEKEMTTPMSYPLTLNSLVTACNQKSNRSPVVSYDEMTVVRALDSLRDKNLGEELYLSGSRVAKYRHTMASQLGLNGKMQALLCVMMLRRAQTMGELRIRTERMAKFESAQQVAETLDELMEGESPFVVMFPPGPGQKEKRYDQTLAGAPKPPAQVVTAPAPSTGAPEVAPANGRLEELEEEVSALRAELQELRREVADFKSSFAGA